MHYQCQLKERKETMSTLYVTYGTPKMMYAVIKDAPFENNMYAHLETYEDAQTFVDLYESIEHPSKDAEEG
jgi:hypothetical protein